MNGTKVNQSISFLIYTPRRHFESGKTTAICVAKEQAGTSSALLGACEQSACAMRQTPNTYSLDVRPCAQSINVRRERLGEAHVKILAP